MSTERQELAEAVRSRLLEEKWLLTPSLRVGPQWLDAMALCGQPVVNVRVKTIRMFAADLAADEIARRDLTILSRRGGGILVRGILADVSEQLQYLRSTPTASLAEAVSGTLQTLRMAGLRASDLNPASFESPEKCADLRVLLSAYETEMSQRRLLDDAALLVLAKNRVAGFAERGIVLFVAPNAAEHALEAELVNAWPRNARRDVEQTGIGDAGVGNAGVDDTAVKNVVVDSATKAHTLTDRELLQFIDSPFDVPQPQHDGTVRITTAIGERNEVRDVLRTCVEQHIPLDHLEVLHTSAQTYVPLIVESLAAIESSDLDTDCSQSIASLATFAEGLPCTMSRPGRLLRMWLDWTRNDFRQSTLLTIFRDGLVRLPKSSETKSVSALVRVFRSIPIGFGRNRYCKIEEFRQSLEDQLATIDQRIEDAEELSQRRESIQRRIVSCKAIDQLCSSLLACVPGDAEENAVTLMNGAQKLLKTLAATRNEFDRQAASRLTSEIDDALFWLENTEQTQSFDAGSWLEALASNTRVGGSGPQPGKLHVDHWANGGHSGRQHTFVLGLDDVRFAGHAQQDPLLLDHERERVSDRLVTASRRREGHVREFSELMRRIRGRVVLSFPQQSLTGDHEGFPSAVVLSAYRLLTGLTQADHNQLRMFLNEQPSRGAYAPSSESQAVDKADWLAWRLCQPFDASDAEALIGMEFPHIARGRLAADARASSRFTEFDGRVPEAGDELSPAGRRQPVMSPSRLQIIGKCPRQYFFKQGLELAALEDVSVDPYRWLDPLAMGSLLHELFEEFLRRVMQEDRLPDVDRDQPLLRELLAAKISAYRERIPPPSDNVFRCECQRLSDIADTFLAEDSEFCRTHDCMPAYFEASIGLEPGAERTPLDCELPISLRISSDRSITIRGRIDRIDTFGSGTVRTFSIWDYKTGSSFGFSPNEPFNQGRVLQPYLYVAMVEHRLAEKSVLDALHTKSAAVANFGFFFPGVQAAGERFQYDTSTLRQGGDLIDQLCQIVEKGAFAATNDVGDCKFCDYRSICDDVASVTANSSVLLTQGEDRLDPMRRVRSQ